MNETQLSNNESRITMAHGGGGIQSQELIQGIFASHFSNPILNAMGDAAIVEIPRTYLAYTTDSYVVKPIFFPGGDIGKLAVCGTVNDLAVSGARAIYMTAGFIIEEGFEFKQLESIVASMATVARACGIMIVAGDTKVVEKGNCDGIFINTSGIGQLFVKQAMTSSRIETGDVIIINGSIADHGMAIMSAREGLSMDTSIESDCAPLNSLAEHLSAAVPNIKFMRDATRGGLATVLCEAVGENNFGIEIDESKIPLKEGTAAACELLGIDPLYVANEGKLVAVVPADSAEVALATMQSHPQGKESEIIGCVTEDNVGKVNLITTIGSRRLITMLSGEQLPRIC
ncbi:MAG: hydrogenase expression/formation protein HypE [Deltaproteobacteria bacterium]|jgi:hydrogenase expression/formation protein HypE|nr:hydrogenase expression/formation protein HypE [Deltaproteobacteria bacterium]